MNAFPRGDLAIVIGAAGGIGGALLQTLQRSEIFAGAVAFSRGSSPPLDLLDEASIAAGAEHISRIGVPRLIIVATGLLHAASMQPEKSWRQLNPVHMADAFAINVIGPALIAKHFLPLLPREGKSVFATLSARVGSIGDNQLGGWYSYRASKSALNQCIRTAAIELKRRSPAAICVALHPGTVQTGLSAPFAKASLEVQPPAAAAERLLAVVDRLGPADTGGFFDHRGATVPW